MTSPAYPASPAASPPDAPAPEPLADHDPREMRQVLQDLRERFNDFDQEDTYRSYMGQATSKKAANFAVRFGVETAEIAINLKESDVKALLQLQARQKDDKVTWINIWSPSKNPDMIKAIAAEYKFSTRLRETIMYWDGARNRVAANQVPNANHVTAFSSGVEDFKPPRPRLRSTFRRNQDPEKGLELEQEVLKRRAAMAGEGIDLHDEDLDMYRLLQTQYNYTTIDHGPSFVCIGANWLHHRPQHDKGAHGSEDIYKHPETFVPPKHWAWYILTNQGTVISIHEDPAYGQYKGSEAEQDKVKAKELANMRKNTRDLLHQLSKPGMKEYKRRVSARKGVRSDLIHSHNSRHGPLPSSRTAFLESSVTVDAAANLFYYLFEDYTAATSILSDSSRVLAKLTQRILRISDRKSKVQDNFDIPKVLYARSKDLRQLKHLFISYENLITSIMKLGVDTASDEKDYAQPNTSTASLLRTTSYGPIRGVKLSQRASDRFDRLNTRMRLLMLDTIDEYLAEKASLSDTYFNLMSQKDSQATSELNRSASLLAKLSVFFLPISFMTSYFSIQIPDLTNNYTGATYWICFAVIATLSFMSLFFFSKMLVVMGEVFDEQVERFQTWLARSLVGVSQTFKKNPKSATVSVSGQHGTEGGAGGSGSGNEDGAGKEMDDE
ncbi:hypothetical protein BD289DRAFT_454739 [Coniella lustricola]|uniref:ADP-ribosylation factor n=1 Tax=Coniella lustricola TaxID=2025994 RepID=A0A2T3A2F6_9PEZI|nr:hypothetical protein BD289DRAFT_454739 [Coniella lustricola]